MKKILIAILLFTSPAWAQSDRWKVISNSKQGQPVYVDTRSFVREDILQRIKGWVKFGNSEPIQYTALCNERKLLTPGDYMGKDVPPETSAEKIYHYLCNNLPINMYSKGRPN